MATTEILRPPPPAPASVIEVGTGRDLVRPTQDRPSRRSRRVPRQVRRLVGPLLVLGLWQLVCSLGVFSSVEVASPLAVVDAGRQLWATGELQTNLLISLQRVAEGLVVGVAAGVVLAVISGLFHRGEDLVDPIIQAARSVPILGLVPLAIIWFGVGETPKVFLIALGCTFPVYINTFAAIRGVDSKLVEAGQTFGLRRWGLVRRVILPGALPGFLVGLRFALVSSWLIVVVAEVINAKSGIGYLINEAQSWNRTDIIMLGLAIYAVLGLVADAIVRLLERRLLTWRRGFTGS
ncbi:MAG TPA: ABC transporter permease [Acidimicrobiales bacterium]|nr:ABC transporter permease [Acidimicrobiales bacterium]